MADRPAANSPHMNASKDLKEIIAQSTFEVIDGNFVYTKAKSTPTQKTFFLVTQDKDEITVVTEEKHLADIDVLERNKDIYALIALHVSVPFYSVGFLAAITDAIAIQGMNILIVSTFSKDYIMVRKDLVQEAVDALTTLGLTEKVDG